MLELVQEKHKTLYPVLFKISAHKAKYGGELLKDGEKLGNSLRGLFSSDTLSSISTLANNVSDYYKKLGDFSAELSKSLISKDIYSVEHKPFEDFIFPYPTSLQEKYGANYEESEFNISKIKIDAIEKAIPGVVGLVPVFGGKGSEFSSLVISGLRDNMESYAKRNSMFLDPNIKHIFNSMQPRTISMSFNFVFENKKHRQKVLKGLQALKELSLASQDRIFHNDTFPMRYLRMDTVFSFEYLPNNEKKLTNLNDILHCKIKPNKTESEGFYLASISITPESLESAGGYLEDGSPKKISVSLDFVEVRPILRDAWEEPKSKKFDMQKFYPNSEIEDFITIKTFDLTTKTFSKVKSNLKPSASKSVESKTELPGAIKEGIGSFSDIADATSMKEFSKGGVVNKVVADAGMSVGSSILNALKKNEAVNKAMEIGSSVSNFVSGLCKELHTSIVDLYNEKENAYEKPQKIKEKADCIWILPIPRSLPSDDLSHTYEGSRIDNLKRLEQGAVGKKIGQSIPNYKATAVGENTPLKEAFKKTMGAGIVDALNTIKNISITKTAREGIVFNPFEVRTYGGTNLRKYEISYNILFRNTEHFNKIIQSISALKYYMSATDITAGDGEALFNTFLRRPHYFTLDFNNDILNEQYGILNMPLNLVSIDTFYDDPLATDDGLPKMIKIKMQFSEVLPRRKI